MGTSIKGKNFLPEGVNSLQFASRWCEFFPLRADPYGMENTFTKLGDLP